jgi:hypothetical protein
VHLFAADKTTEYHDEAQVGDFHLTDESIVFACVGSEAPAE